MTTLPERSVPTVVVARTPAPGRERDFDRWLQRLAAASRHAPGHVQSEVQPPDDIHPGEWITVYQFEHTQALNDWLASSTRRTIMEAGAELSVGEAREQIIALTKQADPVTAVASFRVKPGDQHRHAELQAKLVARMSAFPGYLRSEVFQPVLGVQDDTVVVFSFDSRARLDDWLCSDERQALLREIEDSIDGDRTLNVVGGFGGWFAERGATSVRTWKQASVVLLALFPTALTLTYLRRWLLPEVGVFGGVLIGNVLGVAILSWLLMPVLTRLLDGWLRR